jgi:hypothetical protein
MELLAKRWKKLFLFGIGISVAAAFCMKWIEPDLRIKSEPFSIIGLEWFYNHEKLASIMAGLDYHVKTILSYHLSFDFVFMAGVYPAIAALCMIAAERLDRPGWRKALFIVALLQLVAWICDIGENYYLLKWLKEPVLTDEFGQYHVMVATKWILALGGIIFGIACLLARRKLVIRN